MSGLLGDAKFEIHNWEETRDKGKSAEIRKLWLPELSGKLK